MGKWSELKASEKARVIQLAILNGVSDVNTIRDTYNIYAEGGGIHIDPSKKGTFTAAASKHGKSVQAFASQVLAHKENYSPAMVRKANFARNAAHWHDDGGDLESPTLEQFITDRLAAIRLQALEKSRKKTDTTPVDIEKVYGKGYVKQVLQGYVDDAQDRLNAIKRQERERNKGIQTPEFLSPNTSTRRQSARLVAAEHQLEEAQKMLSGEIPYTPAAMSNCIANLSELFPHGLPYGNETFKANPGKYGFKIIDTWNVEPGDIVQHAYPKPHHAMLYNGVVDGKHTFNYSTGTMPYSDGSGYGTYRHYPDAVSPDGEHLHDVNVYRYVGTPQDSLQWTKEWMQMYAPNFMVAPTEEGAHIEKTGGPLYPFSFSSIPAVRFDEGGSTRNWDNTLAGKLINYVENSDSIGWVPSQRIWQHPTLPGYDKNQIGMGVDKNKTEGYAEAIKVDKDGVPYMTEEGERRLRYAAIEKANESANQRYKYAQTAVNRPKGTVSKVKDAAVVSAIYNLGAGFVARGLFEDKDFMLKLFDGTDKEVIDRINLEYQKKKRNERVQKTNEFLQK